MLGEVFSIEIRRRGSKKVGGSMCGYSDVSHLVIGEVTPHQLSRHYHHDCIRIEFLTALGHGKGRVQNLNSNPAVLYVILIF